ncbi:MAG: hypothetical protein F6J87_01090 [Spirulina sp. SIO3F2]|nr:hypothetical protein [Spirulina sp. SIO3F2]
MGQTERLVMMAEDELTQYSTDARKIEKLRRKIGLSVTPAQQQQVKQELLTEIPDNIFSRLVIEQRQAIALPFWGIAGLGLLLGISFRQPLDFLGTALALPAAIAIQRWGWQLQAKRLVIQTIDELTARSQAPKADES